VVAHDEARAVVIDRSRCRELAALIRHQLGNRWPALIPAYATLPSAR
jgi:hypothetical protein